MANRAAGGGRMLASPQSVNAVVNPPSRWTSSGS